MLILGILLVIAALVVFGFLFLGTSDLDPLQIDLGIFTVELTPLHLFLLGAATLVVLVLGLLFLTMGLRASRRRQREVKELRKAVDQGPAGDDRPSRREAPAEREIPGAREVPTDRDSAVRSDVPPAPTGRPHDPLGGTSTSPSTRPPAASGRDDDDRPAPSLPADHRETDPPDGPRHG